MPKLVTVDKIVRNYQQVKREKIEQALVERLTHEKVGSGIAVLGGAVRTGKTTLVSQYYFDHAQQYAYCFWLRASSCEELFQAIKKIIEERADIPDSMQALKGNLHDLNDALAKLKQIFEAMTDSWLLVIDDLGIKELDTLLPEVSREQKHHVIITITTEIENADLLLSDNAPPIISIPKFTLEEHQQLFAQRLGVAELAEQDQKDVAALIEQLGTDIDFSVIASRLYKGEKNRTRLMAINKKDPADTSKDSLNATEIRRKLTLLSLPHLSNDEQLLTTLKLLSLFGNSWVPARWLPVESITTLEKFAVMTAVTGMFPQILLETKWQTILAAELEPAETDFAAYSKLYNEALAKVRAEFAWTRTNYNKKLKSDVVSAGYAKEQGNLAELSKILLTKFAIGLEKFSANTYPVEAILSVVQLANSLGRYHFIQEGFKQALEYYQMAKERFDFLLELDQQKQLSDQKRDKVKDKPIYRVVLKKYGYEACLIYAQEVLHNIGATIVKISWDDAEKATQLNNAIKYLNLAFAWQIYLITHFDQTAIPVIQQQLGLDTKKVWSQDDIKLQLSHFANFTRRVLAQAYTKQKQYTEAEKIYQELIQDKQYMDRSETKPLAHRDLANVQRRQKQLKEASASIEDALKFFPADFPVDHHPGEKEQVLYERAKIYIALKQLDLAKIDLEEIIKIKSESLLYKAKAYYQLAQIAKKKGHSADVLINYKNALAALSKRSSRKQDIYQQYYLELAKQFTVDNEALKEELTAFADMFLHGFMGALKKEKITLKFDPKGNRIQLGLGVTAGLFNIIPKQIGVTVPAHPAVTLQQDLPAVFSTIAKSIADYRKNRNAMQLDNITTVENELEAGIERLANSLINQYAQQIQQLNERGKEQLAEAIITVIVKYITRGDLLTPTEGARLSVEEQLFKQLLNNLPKIELAKKEKLSKWHAYGFFNGPRFIVKTANSETVRFYARKGEAFNPKYKYGYSMVAIAPIPTSAYDGYDSQEQLESAKQSLAKR